MSRDMNMNHPYDKEKMAKALLLLFVLAAAAYLFLLFFLNQRVVLVDVSGCDTDVEQMKYKVSKITCKYDYVEIQGYAYEPGVSLLTAHTTLLAHDPTTDLYYRLPTENTKRTKLTKNADDGCNYDYAQFKSAVLQKKIPGGCRLCIWYQGNGSNKLIRTDKVIFY